MDVLGSKYVRTRKKHQCMGCLRVFEKGHKMHVAVCVDDRIMRTYLCRTCDILIKTDKDEIFVDPCEGYYHEGCTREYLIDKGIIK